ncbi:MAG: DUF4062 domain-containing protein [Gammaproteobacteria bacterium]|nr:DUF4062 domain-containing protein [Gammaproteobacteria bacterium]
MAKPRVFVSSTFFDLRYIRSSLESFIENLGYEAVLSEKGRIAYDPDIPLDESCYREAASVEMFVLIIGGRYGSAASDENLEITPEFYDRYESITKSEYVSATNKDIPVYILIEKQVYTEYETFKKNKNNKSIEYAQVDSVNVFFLIEEILNKSRNNPAYQFERHSEIEAWLKEQWAGLFRELINRRTERKQLASLSERISELSSINSSLQRYMEAVVSRVSATPEEANELIQSEQERIDAEKIRREFRKNQFVRDMLEPSPFDNEKTLEPEEKLVDSMEAIIKSAASIEDIASGTAKLLGEKSPDRLLKHWKIFTKAVDYINEARRLFNLPEFEHLSDSK